jgi:acetyl esterase/lipase
MDDAIRTMIVMEAGLSRFSFASPLYADMTGFPPLRLRVGSGETLLDDTLRLSEMARQAGVEVMTEIWAGMVHQWQLFPFCLDDARRSNLRVDEYAVEHSADNLRNSRCHREKRRS